MASLIKFLGPDDNELFVVKNHIVDICKSHTIIYDKTFFSKYRIIDTIDSTDIDRKRIRVNFSSGSYLLIRP